MVYMYDVLIIGGGVIGCSIARELSKYCLKVCLVEKNNDIASGSSRANSAIVHAGYDCRVGSLMAELNVKGNQMYTQVCSELDVPFRQVGSFVLAFNGEEEQELLHLYHQGQENNVPGLQIISQKEIHLLEPRISKNVIAALWAPTGGITCPYELTIALAESAAMNGVDIYLDYEVTNIVHHHDKGFMIYNKNRCLSSTYIINAAGLYCDLISSILHAEEFKITARKGEYLLLDHSEGEIIQKVLFQTPGPMGKGVLVTPTVDGNLLIGPTAKDQDDKEDTSTTDQGIDDIKKLSKISVPDIDLSKVITSFAGIRAVSSTGDFIIQPSYKIDGLIQVAGICSPGLTSAPAIAVMVVGILRSKGLVLEANAAYRPYRKRMKPFKMMNLEERQQAIKTNPAYGHIICRCEMVSEAEILSALHGFVPAESIDGIKRRTRAGMGRCQGGFCSTKIMEIIAKEKNITLSEIVKSENQSWIVNNKIKEGKETFYDDTCD